MVAVVGEEEVFGWRRPPVEEARVDAYAVVHLALRRGATRPAPPHSGRCHWRACRPGTDKCPRRTSNRPRTRRAGLQRGSVPIYQPEHSNLQRKENKQTQKAKQ